jgi:hypothetical protein
MHQMHVVCMWSPHVILLTFVAPLFCFELPPKNKDATKVSSTFVMWGDHMRITCIWCIHGPHASMFAPALIHHSQ